MMIRKLICYKIYAFTLFAILYFYSCRLQSGSETISAGVAITFDDVKYLEDWLPAVERLNTNYEFRATFFVDHFDALGDKEIDNLHRLIDWGSEIGYHGLRHRDAVRYCADNSVDKYIEEEIADGLQLMGEKGFFPASFAYPMGSREKEIDNALLPYFRILRGTYAEYIAKPPASFYQVRLHGGVINAVKIDTDAPYATSDILKGLSYALQYNCIILLYGHGISEQSLPMYVPCSRLETLCTFVRDNHMVFYTMSDLIQNREN